MHKLSGIKNLLVLAVVALPLLFLTLQNLLLEGGTPQAAALNSGDKPIDVASLIASSKTRAEAERKGLLPLSDSNLFGDPPLPDLELPELDPKAWQKVKKARANVERLAKIYHDPRMLDPETERAGLKPLALSQTWDDLFETQPIRDWIAQRVNTLSVLIDNKDFLAEAQKAKHDKKYAKCLEFLAKLHKEALTSEQFQLAKNWEKEARFRNHWAPITASKDIQVRAHDLELQLAGSPETFDTESEALLSETRQTLNGLKVELRLAALFKSPPQLGELLEQCQSLAHDDPAILPKVRVEFRGWMSRQILEQKPRTKDHPDVKEAWLKAKPERIEGVFEMVGSGESKRYQVWTLEDWLAKATKGQRYKTYYLSDFETEPKPPVEPRVVKEFNAARKNLLAKLDSEEEWKRFLAKAGELQEELNSHYSRLGKDPQQGISFQGDIEIAQTILSEWGGASDFLANK